MERETGINYTRQLKAIWRFKWLILLATIIAGGAALPLSFNRPTIYHATTTIMIETTQSEFSLPFDLGFSSTQDFSSQIAIIGSKSVLEGAISQLEPDKAADPDWLEAEITHLQDNLRIEQISGTNLVYISVFSNNPAGLQEQADAIAEAYISEASTGRTATLNEAVEYATEQLKILSSGEIDITVSPSFPKFSAQLNNTLSVLEQVSAYLAQLKVQDTVTNALSVASLQNQLNAEINRVDRISELSSQLDSGLVFIGIIDSQVTVLQGNIQDIRDQFDTFTHSDATSAFYSDLEDTTGILGQAAVAVSNISTELYTLTRIIEREQYAPSGEDLVSIYSEAQTAIRQEASVIGITPVSYTHLRAHET